MQAIPGNIQSLGCSGGVEHGEDSFHRLQQVGPYSASIVAFIEPFQTPMLKAPNHEDTPYSDTCHLSTRTVYFFSRAERQQSESGGLRPVNNGVVGITGQGPEAKRAGCEVGA